MKCPIDGTALVMTERSGIEIDYCPSCRGVWLDRGELDKIIERAVPTSTPGPTARPEPPRDVRPDDRVRDDRYRDDDRDRKRWDDDDDEYRRKRRKSGFLGELFDF